MNNFIHLVYNNNTWLHNVVIMLKDPFELIFLGFKVVLHEKELSYFKQKLERILFIRLTLRACIMFSIFLRNFAKTTISTFNF